MGAESNARVVLDATLDGASVIRGTLTTPEGHTRDFHGWLELTAAIEAALTAGRAEPGARQEKP